MSSSKHFNKIAWIVTGLALIITILFMFAGNFGLESTDNSQEYESLLFDNSKVHTIDIQMDDWDEFIENATSEEYYAADLEIDGETFNNVAIRGKGNTSLSNVASMDSDRYSFKVEFDQYNSGYNYHGLDKLSLNNLIQDSTMMKDYLTYTMMNEFGVNSSLCSFVYITVNGEDWGLYLAVEGVEDSFLERNYGSDHGELYKPDSMSMGGGKGNGKDFDMDEIMNSDSEDSDEDAQESEASDKTAVIQAPSDAETPASGGSNEANEVQTVAADKSSPASETASDSGDAVSSGNSSDTTGVSGFSSDGGQPDMSDFEDKMAGNGEGGLGGMNSSSDVKLQYIDDEISSYTNIWDNAKTDITTKDKNRLIESLEKLSNCEDLDSVVDVEQVIRYFVVHNYVCNGDSYTGSMVHNYYLYEKDGQLSMIPWDYNLAFGTFQGGNAQSTVNTPIDSPVSDGSSDDRPMWNWILSDETYTEMYHQYFTEFLSTVDIESIIDEAYNLIKPYVEKDPTAFYTYEEFEQGVATLKSFCSLRSESITQQISNGETTTDMSYVDASSLSLSDMGSMGGQGGMQMTDSGDAFSQDGQAGGDTSSEADGSASDSDSDGAGGDSEDTAGSGNSSESSSGGSTDSAGGSSSGEANGQPTQPGGSGSGKQAGGQAPAFGDNAAGAGENSESASGTTPQAPPGGFDTGGSGAAAGEGGTTADGSNTQQAQPGSVDPGQAGQSGDGTSSAGGDGSSNTGTSEGAAGTDAAAGSDKAFNPGGSDFSGTGGSSSDNGIKMQENGEMPGMSSGGFDTSTIILLAVSLLLLIAGLIIAKKFRR